MILEGNIREKLTFIMLIKLSACDNLLYNKLIYAKYNFTQKYYKLVNSYNLNEQFIQDKILLIQKSLHISENNYKTYFTNNDNCDIDKHICIGDCNTFSISKNSFLNLARTDDYPFYSKIRRKKDVANTFTLKVKDIYPELSQNELRYININNKKGKFNNTPEEAMPWDYNGYKLYSINKHHILYKLTQLKYKNFMIAGPSGSTDSCIELFSLFKNFDLDLSLLACIYWVGNTLDHSLYEILLIGNAHGKNYDTIDVNVDEEIKLLFSNIDRGKTKGGKTKRKSKK
jgi:hypothetical protein